MLQPPGSSTRSGGSKAYASNRRKTQESPTDQMRKLTKLPPNKKCADCQSKLPQCVNMSVGSFVCMACAGIHRELNNKVKSLGHSTFTDEEVEMMKETDNDKVNALWLARYDPSRERMKPPNGNQDQNQLRAWIRRKYQDRQWYGGNGGGGAGPQGGRTGTSQQRGGGRGGGAPPQPTMVQIPPESKPAAAPPAAAVDLFSNFDAPAPAPAQAPATKDDWAGFGGSSQQQQQTFASFGGDNNSSNRNAQPDPFAQAPAPQQPQQNFADFGVSPTNNADPFSQTNAQQLQMAPPPNQNFANFGGQEQQPPQQQQQQPQNFANFGGTQPTDPFAQQQGNGAMPQQQQQGGFASFNNQQPLSTMPQQQQQSDPFAQQQQPQTQQGGFANFNQPNQVQNLQQLPQQGGFAAFNQPQQMAPQMQQPQMPPAQLSQGFGNFPQQQQQRPPQIPAPQHQAPGMQPPQVMQNTNNNGDFGNTNQAAGQQAQQSDHQDPFTSIPQPPGQYQGPNTLQPQQPSGNLQQQQDPNANMQMQSQFPQASQISQQQSKQPANESSAMPAVLKENPMDAFAHLSMNGPADGNKPEAQPAGTMQTAQSDKETSEPKYSAEQIVCYRSNGDRMKAKVVKVHLDDELQPYYTILMPFGKEKQTDDGHLEVLDPAFETIESKLLTLSASQLKEVENFIASLAPGMAGLPAPQSTVASLPPPTEAAKKDQVPTSIHPVSPSGMTNVSQLTQPPPNQLQMPSLSMQPQAPSSGNMGMNAMMMNGGGASNLNTIPSPSPMEKAAAPSMGFGQPPAPPVHSSIPPPEQQNANQMPPPQPPASNGMGMQQQMPPQQQMPSYIGTNAMQAPMQNQAMGIPSPFGKLPNMGQVGASQLPGTINPPPFSQEQHSMGQPQMMQGQMNGSNQAPQMMQGQMNGFNQAPQMTAQPPQMQQQQMMMMQPQMQQQPQNPQTQQPQQHQMQGQAGQVPQSPQGNPFDMY